MTTREKRTQNFNIFECMTGNLVATAAIVSAVGAAFAFTACHSSGGSSAPPPPPPQSTTTAPPTPTTPSNPTVPPAAGFDVVDLADGHRVYYERASGLAILGANRLQGKLVLHHQNGIPSANLGFLTGESGATWTEKCTSQRAFADTLFDDLNGATPMSPQERKETMDSIKSAAGFGDTNIGAMSIELNFESDAIAAQYLANSWPVALPKPQTVRALKVQDLEYDIAASGSNGRSLSALDGRGMPGIDQVHNSQISTRINSYCDVLLGRFAVKLKVRTTNAPIQIDIVESAAGVRP